MKYIIQNDSSKPDCIIFMGVSRILQDAQESGEPHTGITTFNGGFLIAQFDNKKSVRFIAQDCK